MMEVTIPYDMPPDYKLCILQWLKYDYPFSRVKIRFTRKTSEVKAS